MGRIFTVMANVNVWPLTYNDGSVLFNTLPKVLTEHRVLHHVSRYCDCPVKALLSFVQASFYMLEVSVRPLDDLPVVLATPVGACINCGCQLVTNHCTKFKYKVTLCMY